MKTTPFLIFSMPRSMTAWCSCFLTFADIYCQHETPLPVKGIVDFMEGSPFAFTGIADPGMLLRWKEVTEALPTARLIYLRRPNYQSQKAFAKAAKIDPKGMDEGYLRLTEAADEFIKHCEPRVLDWKSLTTEQGAMALWEAATGRTDAPATHVIKMLSLHIEQRPELIQASVRSAQVAARK